MFKNWSWKRWGIAALGAVTVAVGFVFPPAAAFAGPIGAGLVGLAIKTPGDVSGDVLKAHGEAIANAVVPAVVEAVTVSAAGGVRNVSVLAGVARDAAAAALATKPQL
jgi:hypothetical protein